MPRELPRDHGRLTPRRAWRAVRTLQARIPSGDERGQAATEYAVITVMILGGAAMGWPFLVGMINALDTYFQSIYYVIQLAI